jgi:protein-arginine kinase activator protein McsA
MSGEQMCPDPFHEGAGDGERVNEGGSLAIYRCRTCGPQSVRCETYEPAMKSCRRCGKTFEGMADVGEESCDECIVDALTKPPASR